jgi:hypothetical protein
VTVTQEWFRPGTILAFFPAAGLADEVLAKANLQIW